MRFCVLFFSFFFYMLFFLSFFFFFSSRRRHTRCSRDWSSDVCSSDLLPLVAKIKAGGPAADRRGPLLAFRAFAAEQRRHDLRVARLREAEEKIGEPVEVVRRHAAAQRGGATVEGEHRNLRLVVIEIVALHVESEFTFFVPFVHPAFALQLVRLAAL